MKNEKVSADLGSRMRDGIRNAVSRRSLNRVGGSTLLAVMCAGAFAPVAAAAIGTGAVVSAGAGIAGGFGGGLITSIVHRVVDRMRGKDADSLEMVEARLLEEFERALAGHDEAQTQLLRTEIGRMLVAIGGGRAAIEAVVKSENEETQRLILSELADLAIDFEDFGSVLVDIHQMVEELQDDVARQETRRRADAERQREQAQQLRLVRDHLTELNRCIDRRSGAGSDNASRNDPAWISEAPYRGLLPFHEHQAAIFHGRTRLVAQLAGHVEECLDQSNRIIVTGASGAGKSSLIRAGLLPAIRRGQVRAPAAKDWPHLVMSPGNSPLEELSARLAVFTGSEPSLILEMLSNRPERVRLYARQALVEHADSLPPGQACMMKDSGRLLIFIDQFEELFTQLNDNSDREMFLAALKAVSEGESPPALVIIGVRGDFIDRCAEIPMLVPILQHHQFVVGPPRPEELRQAITGPAAEAGLRIEEGLADDLLADLDARQAACGGTAGVLPLLSQMMLSLWNRRDGDHLTRRGYQDIGGVGEAIELEAELVFQRLDSSQQTKSEELFRNLTVVDRNGEASRRRATRNELPSSPAELEPILEAFTEARLIVNHDDTVEISHDVLLRSWKRLGDWLQKDRVDRARLTEVADDATAWIDHEKDSSFLYQGAKLESAQAARSIWESNPQTFHEWNADVHGFLVESGNAAAKRAKTRRRATVLMVVLSITSLVAAGIALNFSRVAAEVNSELTSERNRLLAEELARSSHENIGVDGDLARLLAMASHEIDPTPEADSAVARALGDVVSHTFEPFVSRIDDLAIAPDGGLIVVSSMKGEIVVWDTEARSEIARTGEYDVQALDFSPDGQRLALGTSESVMIVNPFDLELEAEYGGTGRSPEHIGFTESEIFVIQEDFAVVHNLESADADRIWLEKIEFSDAVSFARELNSFLFYGSTGLSIAESLEGPREQIWSRSDFSVGAVSDSGEHALSFQGSTAILHSIDDGTALKTIQLSGSKISGADIDSTAESAVVHNDKEVRVIDLAAGETLNVIETGFNSPSYYDVDSELGLIAVAGAQGVQVLSVDQDWQLNRLIFEDSSLSESRVKIHPSGESILLSAGGSHRLIDIRDGSELEVPWDPDDWIADVSFSPDGEWVVVMEGENLSSGTAVQFDIDRFATVYHAETWRPHLIVSPVMAESTFYGGMPIAFSPDGRTVASVSTEVMRTWDLESGDMVQEIFHEFAGHFVSFGLGGEKLVTNANFPTVWDLDSESLLIVDDPYERAYLTPPPTLSGGVSGFGPNDDYVIRALDGPSGVIEVWSSQTGSVVSRIEIPANVLKPEIVQERNTVLNLDESGNLYVTELDYLNDPIALLCERTDRTFTNEEWSEYLGSVDRGSIALCDLGEDIPSFDGVQPREGSVDAQLDDPDTVGLSGSAEIPLVLEVATVDAVTPLPASGDWKGVRVPGRAGVFTLDSHSILLEHSDDWMSYFEVGVADGFSFDYDHTNLQESAVDAMQSYSDYPHWSGAEGFSASDSEVVEVQVDGQNGVLVESRFSWDDYPEIPDSYEDVAILLVEIDSETAFVGLASITESGTEHWEPAKEALLATTFD